MTLLLILLAILAISALSIPFGKDSRDLREHRWETPWDRLPR